MDNTDKQLKLSKFLLQKYTGLINEREQRTIGEIKALVDGTDLSIQSIISEFKDTHYTFRDNYKEVFGKVYGFIKDDIDYVNTNFGINYWLSAKEILEVKVVDDEDLAVFTCSCMKALGDDNADVIIAELENLTTHAFVSTTFGEEFAIIDPAQKHEFNKFIGNKKDIIRDYSFEGNKIKKFLYRFNHEKYEQFIEE
jgi:hypothetical protein